MKSDQTVDLYRVTGELISNDPVTANNGMIGYTYDNVGNRQQRTSSITAIPMQNFTGQYDPDDRLTAGYTYDGDGSTLTDPTGKTFTYDSLDRLVSVTGTGLNENFVYDGDGNKVSQTVNGVTTNYLIDFENPNKSVQVLEELQGSEVNAVYTYGTTRISEDLFNGTSWALSFYGYDGQGSVRYLTDVIGNITDRMDYDSFGIQINRTGVTNNEFFYDGEQLDGNTGFYNLRARWMNPALGRFQTMDSFEGGPEDPTSLHKYLFCGSNPTNNYDPTGNQYSAAAVGVEFAAIVVLSSLPNVLHAQQVVTHSTHVFLGETQVNQRQISQLPWYLRIFAPEEVHAYFVKTDDPHFNGDGPGIINEAVVVPIDMEANLKDPGSGDRLRRIYYQHPPVPYQVDRINTSAQEVIPPSGDADSLWQSIYTEGGKYKQDSLRYDYEAKKGVNSNSYIGTIVRNLGLKIEPSREAIGWEKQLW